MRLAALWLLVVGACVRDPGYRCFDNGACGSGGLCEPDHFCSAPVLGSSACPSGRVYQRSAGPELAGHCTHPALDGGADAGPDACAGACDAALPPPVTVGQPADLVLGQVDLRSATANAGGLGASSLAGPAGVAAAGARVWVADSGNQRVLQWDDLPARDGAPAQWVYGQSSMTAHLRGVSETQFDTATAVASDGVKLFVADGQRILAWNSIFQANFTPADLVVGQSTFTGVGVGTGAAQVNVPKGLWFAAQKLFVADLANYRVLVYAPSPISNGSPASLELGQPGYGPLVAPVPPTAASLDAPSGVFFDGTRLFVADTFNNRVLIWNQLPTSNGAAADIVVGQTGMGGDRSNADQGVNAAGFDKPVAALVAAESLFVSDSGNHRVLVFTPVPRSNGASARAVLGQPDFTSNTLAGTPAADRLSTPQGMAVSGRSLYVADQSWNRVVRFTLSR